VTGVQTCALPISFAANPLFQVFRIEGKKAGARIARLLLGLGHTSVAYISSQHMNAYSQQRLEGIQDQFTKAGIANGVHAAITDRIEIGLLHLLDISGFEESVIRKVVKAGGRTESQAQDQWKAWLEFKEQKKPKLVLGQDLRVLKKNLAGIRDLANRDIDPGYFDAMCLAALTKSGTQLSRMILAPLFEEALKHQDATAWICVSDGTAIAALEFLRMRNIPVPARISITGFDNEPVDAVTQRLTSFDFNAPAFIHSMLNFIAHPPKPRGTYRHSTIEVEGIVMQRDTTAPAKQGAGKT
jgi:DNA-binding LacI/PurR family transcriptional regulator